MTSLESYYLPHDRRRALAAGVNLPSTVTGSALFADISGFTPITEKLRQTLGVRGGAEALAAHLNRVYDALIAQVEGYGGSVIGFAGDAITCWFDGENAALAATQCAGTMMEAMQGVEQITLPDGETGLIGLKVSIASGSARRFAVGDPALQMIDVLAGATVARMASGEELAARGEIVADEATVERLGDAVRVREWREHDGQRFAVLEGSDVDPLSMPGVAMQTLSDDTLRPWVLPALARHLQAGLGEFLIELRATVALFLRFSGIDYDDDSEAEDKLNRLVRLVQGIVSGYDGNVIQLTIGDKGSYLYASFGAPFAHEDDAARALNAAIDIREGTGTLDTLNSVQIGISQGMMRTGAYGSVTRRTYGVLGDEVNVAARLMSKAEPGTILMSETVMGAKLDGFRLESLPPLQVKGKANPIQIYRVIGRRERSFEERFYTTPFVGREEQLADLREALAPIWQGRHAGVITLYGEPGMGKSRLAFEIQRRLQGEAKITWLTGQADTLKRAPLGVFAYFLRPYFGQQRERNRDANLAAFDARFDALLALADETTQADLRLTYSFLAGLVGLVMPGSLYQMADEKLRVDNGIIALKAFARAEGRRQPLVFHLEDAQWLDTGSISAIQRLTYNMDSVPLVFVLTSRYNDDETRFTIPNIFSVPVHAFDLNRLSDDGVRAVAEAMLNGTISDGLRRFIHERAEGNPFFTEQLALDLKERGALVEREGGWDIHPDTAAEVPSEVNAVLIARLDRLAAQVKSVVQTAAVLGREFDVMVLSQMLREDERSYIQTAESEAIWTALDALRYLFRHALLRDAAYRMQVQERLKGLHRLAAEIIEALYPDDATQNEVLLEHWQNAGVADKILFYTAPVCERLITITADYARAETLLRKAFLLDETPVRAVLLRQLGDVARLRGQHPEATAHYDACLAAAGEDVVLRSQVLNALGNIRMTLGDNVEAAAFFEQGLDLARQAQDQMRTANVMTSIGMLAFRQGDNDLAQTYFTECLRLHRELENHRGIINALNNLSSVAGIKGNHTLAYAYLEESLALASKMGHRLQMGMILSNLGTTALQQGDYQAARPYYESSLSIRREIGERDGIGAVLGNLAILARRQGDLVEAQAYAEASLHERRAIGDKRGIANALGIVASLAYDQNEHSSAQRYFDETLAMQREINDRWGMATTLINLGQGNVFSGRFAEAEVYLGEGLALYRQLNQPLGIAEARMFQGDLAQEQGDLARAEALYHEALDIQREINDQRGIPGSLMSLAYVDMQSGKLSAAENQLNEALVLLRELELGGLPQALAILAVVKRRSGQSGESVYGLLREALTLNQAKSSLRTMFIILIETAQVLFADKRYITLAELIGLLFEHTLSYRSGLNVNQLLDELRPHLDTRILEAALERGKLLTLDEAVTRLLAELV